MLICFKMFQKAGTGVDLPLCCITTCFNSTENIWKLRRVLKRKCCPIPVLKNISAAQQFETLSYFCFMMHQMFSVSDGSGLRTGQFSTWTLLLQSCAVVIHAECSFTLSC